MCHNTVKPLRKGHYGNWGIVPFLEDVLISEVFQTLIHVLMMMSERVKVAVYVAYSS